MDRKDMYWYYILPIKFIGNVTEIIKSEGIDDFQKSYSEIVLERENSDFCIRLSRDWFLHIEVKWLEQELDEMDRLDDQMKWDGYFAITKKHIHYLNALNLLIASEYKNAIQDNDKLIRLVGEFDIQKLDNTNVVRYVYDNRGVHMDTKMNTYTKYIQENRYWLHHKNGLPLEFQMSHYGSLYIPFFKNAFDKFLSITEYSRIKLMSHMVDCITEYKEWNFAQSFILAWFFIESYIWDNIWKGHIESLQWEEVWSWRVSSERKKFLIWHDQFSISWVLEICELLGLISIEEYKILSKFRKKRNKLVHWFVGNLENLTQEDMCEILYYALSKVGTIVNNTLRFSPRVHCLNHSSSCIPKRHYTGPSISH